MILSLLLACNERPVIDDALGGPVELWFNDPGSRLDNVWEPDVIDAMVALIDRANATIDLAVMGFSHPDLVDALVAAYDRGIAVRMVGDAGHLENAGYITFRDRHIPLVAGNSAHIMHDKFMVVDGRFVFVGTANWTPSDLEQNANNFVMIDSPAVAADFTAEHAQMFAGTFGQDKIEIENGRTYTVGDTEVEVWFSPNEDAMGRILELVDAAESSIRFSIFAFTKDQLGSALVRRHEEGVLVEGVVDQSQLHSNGQFSEVFRLLQAQVPLRMDGIDSSTQPGDYQAGGGRLHAKTMIIDAEGASPVVITGSFNWSASATQSNDEYLLVMHGADVSTTFDGWWESLWGNARDMGSQFVGNGVNVGDLWIDEVMWFGVTPDDPEGYDEFIELRNRTAEPISLDLWQIASDFDTVVGFPPGSTIPGNGRYLVVDHLLERFEDGLPQDGGSATTAADMVVNPFNDDRAARLYLEDEFLRLRLLDPLGVEADVVGDAGPPFAGGPGSEGEARSMERLPGGEDGTDALSFAACPLDVGGNYVREDWRDLILATPGEENGAK